jgi:hypothetical protein
VSPSEHLCPRRSESAIGFPGPDRWETGHGVVGQDEVGLSCSYCGSLHPARFMELVREGWTVGPTDKNYKAYLNAPVTDDDRERAKSRWASGITGQAVRKTLAAEGVGADAIEARIGEYWSEHEEPYLTGRLSAKFYFQHLSIGQRHEFIELHNSKAMQIGWPGRLYVPPFFCGFASAREEGVDA